MVMSMSLYWAKAGLLMPLDSLRKALRIPSSSKKPTSTALPPSLVFMLSATSLENCSSCTGA